MLKRLIVILFCSLAFFTLSSCGEAEETMDAEIIEERISVAYEEGWDAGWEFGYDEAKEKYTEILRETAEHVHKLEGMIDDYGYYTIDDIYGEVLEAEDCLSDYY